MSGSPRRDRANLIPAVRDRLLTCKEFGEETNTSERFARRLIAERRITFVKIGRHVRIPESAVAEFIEVGTIEAAS